MKKRLLTGIAICLFCPAFAAGIPNERIVLNGVTDNPQLTALRARLFTPFYFIQRQNIDVTEHIEPIQQQQFQLVFENISRIVYMHLFVQSNRGEIFLGSYIAEPGDSIHIRLEGNRLLFSGKGSAKYNCIKALKKQPFKIPLGLIEPEKTEDYTGLLHTTAQMKDSVYQLRLKLLHTYRQELSEDAYRFLQAELNGEYRESLYGDIYFYLGFTLKGKQQYAQLLSRLQQLESAPPDTANGAVLSLSEKYTAYLFTRLKTILFAAAVNKGTNEKPTVKSLLALTEKYYRGALRDKLTATIFYSNYQYEDSVLSNPDQFTRLISDRYLQAAIRATCSKKQQGAAAFPFLLKDSSNQVHSLDMYKGKTIVMMVWVSGCPASEYLGMALQQFAAHYSDREDIVFITVNADKNSTQWKSSVTDKILLPEKAVHVSAGPQGSKESMLQHYEIVAYPQLLVINSRGRIVSSCAPRPVTEQKAAVLRSMVEEKCSIPDGDAQ